ncbi:MAG: tetratricopeptide repeat protein, partial [Pseudomonadota bacterium]
EIVLDIAQEADPERRAALAKIADPLTRDQGLRELALYAETADDWRQVGELASPWNVSLAVQAYETAIRLGSDQFWDRISLARLYVTADQLSNAQTALTGISPDGLTLREQIILASELGKIAQTQGHIDAARGHFETSPSKASSALDDQPDDSEAIQSLLTAHILMGDFARSQQDMVSAQNHYETALNVATSLIDTHPDSDAILRDKSVIYDGLADLAASRQDIDSARDYFEKSLAIAITLAEKYPANWGLQRDVSVSFEKMGNVARVQERLEDAKRWYDKAYDIRKDIYDSDTSNLRSKRDLAVILEKLGRVDAAEGNIQEALASYDRSLALRQALVAEQPTNSTAKIDLAIMYNAAGDMTLDASSELSDDNISEAETLRLKAIDLYTAGLGINTDLRSAAPDDARVENSLIASFNRLGEAYHSLGETGKASQHYQSALALSEIRAERSPESSSAQINLAIAYANLAFLGDEDELSYWREADTVFQAVADRSELTRGYMAMWDEIKTNIARLEMEAPD